MSAIRNPTELSADIMREWASVNLGSRIVVTGTSAESLEQLSNDFDTAFGVLLAIESVIYVRKKIFHTKEYRDVPKGTIPTKFPDAHVVCLKTIHEFIDTLDHTIPLAWIHLGHGDFEYEIDGEDDGGEWGADYAMLSNGEPQGDWIRTVEISKAISESKGKDSMLFCILPVCLSSHSGDVLQSNPKILAIHATELDSPTDDGTAQLLDMQYWVDPSAKYSRDTIGENS